MAGVGRAGDGVAGEVPEVRVHVAWALGFI